MLDPKIHIPKDGKFPQFKNSDILAISPPTGWGCAQIIRNEAFKRAGTKIINLIPVTTNEIPKEVTEWIDLLNDSIESKFFSTLNLVDHSVLQEYSDENEGFWSQTSNYWVPVSFEIPVSNTWTPHMNLAMYSLVRYLYRNEYVSIPMRARELQKKYPQLTILQLIFLANYLIRDGSSSTFTVHQPSNSNFLPIPTFKEIFSKRNETVFRAFNFDGNEKIPPLISNTMLSSLSREFMKESYTRMARNTAGEILQCFRDLKINPRNIITEIMEKGVMREVAELIISLNNEEK